MDPPDDIPNAPDGPAASPRDVEALLRRVQAGDRAAAAELALAYSAELRSRIRFRISPSLRREIDSEDAAASAARRLDEALLDGSVRAESLAALEQFLSRAAMHAVMDKARSAAARRKRERLLRSSGAQSTHSEEISSLDRDDAIRRFSIDRDSALLTMWTRGFTHEMIAKEFGISVSTARARVSRAIKRLQSRYDE